jgi:dipeptidyl aminopeptidase/acylaminoacyl peptidase
MMLSGPGATVCTSTSAAHAPLLSQDLNALVASNGKILKAQRIDVSPEWDKKTESFKITYLSDGLKITGFVVKPKVAESNLPAIIFNRGGSREYGKVTVGMLKHLCSLAAQGYVVLASQYRGNDGGEGREEFGGKDVNDVLNIINLAKSLQFVDPAKIVMLGYSRGGMMTYLTIKHDADIQAAVVVGGITDVGQLYADRDKEMKKTIRDLVGMDDAEWKKRSANYWPEKIDTPVLILHGEDDRRVDVSQAKKLAQKLEEAGREYELVIFPKGDHGLKTHRAERNRKIFDWFDKYLNR